MTQLATNLQNQVPIRQEQTTTINAKTGKKKIMPKIERIFEDTNASVNPHLNPFTQINDSVQAVSLPKHHSPTKLPSMNEVPKLQKESQATLSQNLT
jgi:ABC-type dipeptide/oligopeptide/nickel transport system ATPase subunit